jgi:hypothetical protein
MQKNALYAITDILRHTLSFLEKNAPILIFAAIIRARMVMIA